jgi:parallel beta-helix repeat protein
VKGQPVWIALQIIALVLMGVAQGASAAFADTWYVRATGDDQNDCRSQDAACATLHETVDKALRDGSGLGDTIFVGAGSYITPASGPRKEGIIIGPGRGGTATDPFQLIADTAGFITGDAGVVEIVGGNSGFVIHASFVTVDGFAIRNPTQEAGVLVYGSNEGIVLQNLDVSGAPGHAISLQGLPPSVPRRKDITILNAVIYNNGSQANTDYGLQIRSTDHSVVQGVTIFNNRSDIAGMNIEKASHNIFEDIVVYNNTGDGIFVEESQHNTFLNILIYNNHGSGIHFSQGGNNAVINATIYGNGRDGYKTSSPDMTEQTLINSIMMSNGE